MDSKSKPPADQPNGYEIETPSGQPSESGIRLVVATAENVHKVVPVFDAYRQWYGMSSDLSGASRYLMQRMTASESVILFAETGEASVPHKSHVRGFTQLYPFWSSISMGAVWVLNDLFVCETFRGQGIGGLLLDASTEFARETGAIRLELETATTNQTAQQFYESRGWKQQQGFLRYEFATQ